MPGTPFSQIILLVLAGAIVIGGIRFLRSRNLISSLPAAVMGMVLIAIITFFLLIRPGMQVHGDRSSRLPADNVP